MKRKIIEIIISFILGLAFMTMWSEYLKTSSDYNQMTKTILYLVVLFVSSYHFIIKHI